VKAGTGTSGEAGKFIANQGREKNRGVRAEHRALPRRVQEDDSLTYIRPKNLTAKETGEAPTSHLQEKRGVPERRQTREVTLHDKILGRINNRRSSGKKPPADLAKEEPKSGQTTFGQTKKKGGRKGPTSRQGKGKAKDKSNREPELDEKTGARREIWTVKGRK